MCTSESWEYKRCKQASSNTRHKKVNAKYCLKYKAGFYANSYHPMRVVNCISDESGFMRYREVDETCPVCYPEEAQAEQEQKKQEEEERKKQEEEKRAAEEIERPEYATPDVSECFYPFSNLKS